MSGAGAPVGRHTVRVPAVVVVRMLVRVTAVVVVVVPRLQAGRVERLGDGDQALVRALPVLDVLGVVGAPLRWKRQEAARSARSRSPRRIGPEARSWEDCDQRVRPPPGP
nr:hypothetical protein GCM10020093_008580 [Planobispora longispora]